MLLVLDSPSLRIKHYKPPYLTLASAVYTIIHAMMPACTHVPSRETMCFAPILKRRLRARALAPKPRNHLTPPSHVPSYNTFPSASMPSS